LLIADGRFSIAKCRLISKNMASAFSIVNRQSTIVNPDGGTVVDLKSLIREVPDFPKPGILFYDITTLLKDPVGLHSAVDALANCYVGRKIDCVVGIEARGFIFAPMVAYRLNAGFVPVRKPNKLPAATARATYNLEYGTDSLEIHRDAVSPGQEVLIIDDLLATGGTAAAVAKLIESLGGTIVGLGFLIELGFLKGRAKLSKYDLHAVLEY
jgi:adenine phosphoribosyltransferase